MDENILDSSCTLGDRSLINVSPDNDEYDLHNDETFGDDCDLGGDDWEEVHEKLAEIEESHKYNGIDFNKKSLSESFEATRNSKSARTLTPISSSNFENSDFVKVPNVKTGPTVNPQNDVYRIQISTDSRVIDNLFSRAPSANPFKSPAIKTVEQLEKELQTSASVGEVKINRSVSPEVAATLRKLSLCTSNNIAAPPALSSWISQIQQMKVNGAPIPVQNQSPIQPIIHPVPHQLSHLPVTVISLPVNQSINFPPLISQPVQKERFLSRPSVIRFEPIISRPITPSTSTPTKPLSPRHKYPQIFNPPREDINNRNLEILNSMHVESNLSCEASLQNSDPMKREYQQRNWSVDNELMDTDNYEDCDPYAGLMTHQEINWIAQIQLMQLNTNKPFEDDYYYTMYHHKLAGSYSLRSAKMSVMAAAKMPEVTIVRNSSYVPVQFENSLGKLQAGSVVAPRKLIDTDLVDKTLADDEISNSEESKAPSNHTLVSSKRGFFDMPTTSPLIQKKSCETLITIEQMFEQVLLLEEDSSPLFEKKKLANRDELIKRLSNHLNENDERLAHMLSVRKGKILVLRLLPFVSDAHNFWKKFISTIETIMKVEDEIFLQFLPFFRRDMQSITAQKLIDLTKAVIVVLSFLVENKVGISILANLVSRGASEYEMASAEEKNCWQAFLMKLSEVLSQRSTTERPVVAVNKETLMKHLISLNISGNTMETLVKAL